MRKPEGGSILPKNMECTNRRGLAVYFKVMLLPYQKRVTTAGHRNLQAIGIDGGYGLPPPIGYQVSQPGIRFTYCIGVWSGVVFFSPVRLPMHGY